MENMTGRNLGPEGRLLSMRILWFAFLLNVVAFAVITYFVAPGEGEAEGVPPLLYALAAGALAAVAASFLVKGGFYRRAAERQEPGRLQTGFILALALCESAALLGMLGVFVTGCDYSYLLFGLGALGVLLHLPRREQVFAPYYKQTV